MKKLLFLATVLLLLFACNKSAPDSFDYSQGEMDNIEAVNAPATIRENTSSRKSSTSPSIPMNRKMIWSADLKFQVHNVDSSTSRISQIVGRHGGFVSNMTMENTRYRINNTIEVRIESKKLHSLIELMKGESVFIDHLEINSKDVTEEYVDIESRLKTKKEARERYIDILRNKTGDVADIIEAEDAIRRITEEIESREGRLRYLKDKIEFSTLVIHLYQKVDHKDKPSVYEKSFGDKIVESFSSGWNVLLQLTLALVNIWPIVILASLLLFWKRKWFKVLKKKG